MATVNTAGLLTALTPGNTTITAALKKTTGSLALTINTASVKQLKVSPQSATVFTNAQQQFTATATYSNSTTGDLTGAVTWSVTPSSVATITAGGLLKAVSAGSFTVTASSGSVTGTATGAVSGPALSAIAIAPANANISSGASQQFTATGTYSDQSTKDLTASVTWASSDTSALTITAAGLATAASVTATTPVSVSAQLGSLSANAAVNVTPQAAMTALQVRPTSSSIAAGTAEQHTALAFYSDGTQQDVTSQVTWSVAAANLSANAMRRAGNSKALRANAQPADSSTSAISVNQSGVDYANQPGAADVQASLGSLQSQSVVLVTAATVNAIAISSTNLLFPINATQQFSLNGWFSDGSSQDLTLTANWQSSDTSIATVNSNGIVTGVSAGRVTLTASFGGLTTTKVAQILSTDLVSTTIRVPDPVLSLGTAENVSVVGTFSDGSSQDLTPLATWSSSDTSVLQIDNTGFVQVTGTGRVQITSMVGGVSSVATIFSVTATLLSIEIDPANASFALGTSLPFTALGFFSDGAQIDLSSSVLWVSSDPTVFTVNSVGRAKSYGLGTATLTASFLGISQTSAAITVTNATLTGLTISPATATIAANTHQQYAATGWFSDGSIQDLSTDALWATSNHTVASVDNDGTVLGLSPGTCTVSATALGIMASAQVTVTSASLLSTIISPGDVELPVRVSRPFSLVGTFSDGTTQDMSADAIWQSPTPSVVFATATGLGFGVSPGIGTLAAVLGNFSSATQVNVTSATLTGITLTPPAPVIRVGGSQQMTATGTFSDGFSQNLYTDAVFNAANNKIVNIGSPGLAVGTEIGSTQVTARFDGITASTTSFQVLSGTLVSIALSPSNPTITAGSTLPLTATGTYADGTTSNISNQVTWTSSNPAVLSIDGNGVATANAVTAETTVTVTATSGSTTASFTVTVYPASGAAVRTVVIAPSSASLVPGATQQFTATATYADGTVQDVSSSVVWSSSNPAAATISSTGLATGVATGSAEITAQTDGVSSSVPLTVSPPTSSGATVSSVALTPANASISAGSTQQFTARATYSDGTLQDVSSSAIWTSSATLTATVNGTGLATGVAAGTASITATSGGVPGRATLTVTTSSGNGGGSGATLTSIAITPATASIAAGTTEQFTATGAYSDSTTQNLTNQVAWSSSNTGAATIGNAGLAAGVATGSTTIGAALSGITASASLTITPGSGATLTSIVITPTSSRVVAGLSQQFTATGTYSDGSTLNLDSSVTWTTSNPSVATVNSTGLVAGVGAGTATITGTVGSLQSQTTVIISTASLSSMAISPSGASLPAGTTQQLILTGTFSDGLRQNLNSAATWSSLAPAVATVSSTGLVTAVSPGTAQVSASYSGQSAPTTVQVTTATLVSVAVFPLSASFAKGTTQQFTVTGTYSDGTSHDLTSLATFTSSNPAVVSVSSSGLATGTGAGATQISVSIDGDTASTQTITVTPATLVSIAITPSTPIFANDTTEQFTAIGTFSDGSTQNLSSQVVWTSSNPQTATIDNNGLATGGAPGSTQISATFGGVTSTTGTVQITPAVLTELSISPTTAQIAKGTTQQFTANGTYSDGTTQNLSSTVTWSSSNGTVVSISASGLATGTSVGSAQISAAFNGETASTSSFQVTPATLVSIAFSPANPSVAAGTNAQMTVTGTFSDGSTQNLSSSATYSSSNTVAVTVSNTGLITGVAPGSSTVTVTVDGVSSTFTVVVTSATLTSITISPANPANFAKGTTEQFTAAGNYSDGSTQDLTSTVAWSSSSPSVLTINSQGLATGTGTGSATVTATYQGQSTTTPSVQVTPAVPASVAITPAATTLTTGSTQQYVATVTYTDETTQDVSSSTTWNSANAAVATISSSGLALGLTAGSTTISGRYDSITGSTGLTVAPVIAPTLASIAVTPSSASVASGNTQQFAATGIYSDGSTQNLTTSATWQSSVPSVATIDNIGLATSVGGGNTQILATYEGVSGIATLTVSPATLVALSVTPATVSLAEGTSQQYRAVGTLSDGSTEDLTTSVTWSSTNNAVATINTSGFATSSSVGSATIKAQAGSISGTAAMTVTAATVVSVQVTPSVVTLPSGGVQQLLVTATFTDGSSQNVTTSAAYSSSSSSVATVDVSGKLTAAGTGSATVTVSLGSESTSVPVVVTSAALTSIAITPSSLSLAVGESQQMTATGTFSDGSTQDLTNSVTWTSSAPLVATVSTTGKVTVSQTGNATIFAADGTVTSSASLTGTSAVVTAIAVSPASATLADGQTQQFAATATMSDGSQQTVTNSAHWSTSDPTKGTISNITGTNGLLVATAAGSFTVSATLNSISGSASVTVTSAALASLTVSPSPVSLPAGTTQAMTVTGNYTDGSTANVTSSASWNSTSASIATVDSNNVLHGVSAGSATVTATVGLVSKGDAVTVTSAVLDSIAIGLSSNNVPLGLQTQLTATGTYSDGSTQNLTSQVQWSSSSPSIATVGAGGLVSTLASGSTELVATLGSVTQQASLTVTAAELESIAVQASQSSFALGLSLQLTAIGTYSDSSTQNLTSQVAWSSLTPSVGVVSSTGLATGLTTGTFDARATLNSVTGSLAITVTSAVLQSITVTPADTIIVNVLGNSVQYTATGHFSDGSTQNITNSCHWAITSGLAVGSISQTGSFSPLGLGIGTLSATSGSIAGSTGFTVVSVL